MRVLNYGVTRGRLRDRLEEGEGWDVINGLIRGGEDLVLVAELVGHARLETLRLYSQLTGLVARTLRG